MLDLGTLGGTTSRANDLSNTGYVTGRAFITNDTSFHAFRIALEPPMPPTPPTRLKITGGNILIGSPGQGLIFKSPNGTCHSLSIDNAGAMTVQTVTCP